MNEMILIVETIIWVFGISVNFFLILKLLIRPILWSTTNTFLGCFLSLNFFHLLVQILLVGKVNNETDPADTVIIQALDNFFSDHYKSIFCSTQIISNFVHGSFTMTVLFGTIFIRSMMVKHADNLRPDNLECKSHQARLSIVGILVAVYIITICFALIIIFILYPLSPLDFVLVRSCRGVPITYPEDEMRMVMRGWMSRLVYSVLIVIATLSCHARILHFKRQHNMSYFSQFRQNIATADQSLAAAYLKIGLAVVKEMLFWSIINDSSTKIDILTFMKISNVLNCIVIPCYWIYSTKKDFREFWSKETVFWRKVDPPTNGAGIMYLSEYVSSSEIEPRGPHIHETRFTDEGPQSARRGRLPRRFSYGFNIRKSFHQKENRQVSMKGICQD